MVKSHAVDRLPGVPLIASRVEAVLPDLRKVLFVPLFACRHHLSALFNESKANFFEA